MAKKSEFIPNILAFEKKIVPSDGLLLAGQFDTDSKFVPLPIIEKSVRGTISNYMKNDSTNDVEKIYAKVESANLQTVDACYLPANADTVALSYTVKFLPVNGPSSCSNPLFTKSFMTMLDDFSANHTFQELGYRYAYNIAAGRTLWRNRLGADTIKTIVKVDGDDRTFTFNGYHYTLRNFETKDDDVKALGTIISDAFAGLRPFTLLHVTTMAKIGSGQEVYPSEELVFNKEDANGNQKKGTKSKILFSVDGTAGIHSQKLGNAIRTIDTWYPAFASEDGVGPISAEPYGAVTSLGTAFRAKKPDDFYSKFYDAVQNETLLDEDADYVMSIIIRGGVFGKKSE